MAEVPERDLTDADQNAAVLELATSLLDDPSIDLAQEVDALFGSAERVSAAHPVVLEATRAAASRAAVRELAEPTHVTVVWAMYGETGRMATRDEHPHGQDFVRAKVEQLRWLFADGDVHSWSIIACDDGCPDVPSSADRMAEIVAEEGWGDRVRVVRLADAISSGDAASEGVAGLGATDESRKGGAILHAMAEALRVGPAGDRRHVVLSTDADLSANLAQVGSLIARLAGDASVAAGQRYGLPGSVLVKADWASTEPESTGSKPDKAIVLFRHWVRATLIPSLAHVLDTQAGFKLIDATALATVLPSMTTVDESVDVELLLRLARVGAIDVAPIVFTEDFSATNFPSVDPGQRHLDMLVQVTDIYDRFVADTAPVDVVGRRLIDAVRTTTLDRYVSLIEWIRANDHDDPTLFDRRWRVDDVVARLGAG